MGQKERHACHRPDEDGGPCECPAFSVKTVARARRRVGFNVVDVSIMKDLELGQAASHGCLLAAAVPI